MNSNFPQKIAPFVYRTPLLFVCIIPYLIANFVCTSRFAKLDEARQQRDQELQLTQAHLENERRQQEREHKLKLFSLLTGSQSHIGYPGMTGIVSPPTTPTGTQSHIDYSGMMEMVSTPAMPAAYYPHNWDQSSISSHSSSSSSTTNEARQYTSL